MHAHAVLAHRRLCREVQWSPVEGIPDRLIRVAQVEDVG